jgi:hypothetical protein
MKDIPVFPALRVNLLKNFLSFSRVLNKVLLSGCSKTLRYKAPDIPRIETYMVVRRNDEG